MEGTSQIIYCIGDSHAGFFSGRNERIPPYPYTADNLYHFFKSFVLGPVLAYNLGENDTKSRGREKLFELLKTIPKNSKLLLCFGEIDCRAHLLKQAQRQSKDIKFVAEECASRYGKILLELRNLGFSVAVWGVIPSSLSEKTEYELPTYGSCLERNRATIFFNGKIEKICSENNLKYISIFNELTDSNGLTNTEYYMDPIHLSRKAMPIALKKFKSSYPEINFKIDLDSRAKLFFIEITRHLAIYKSKMKYLANRCNPKKICSKN